MRAKPDNFSYFEMGETCDALAASGSTSALAALRAALSDRNDDVRLAAACALASVGDSSGRSELRSQLGNHGGVLQVRIVGGLQVIGGATNNELIGAMTAQIILEIRRRSLVFTGLGDWLQGVMPVCIKTIELEGTERSPLFDKLYAELRAQILHIATDTNRQAADFGGPLERCEYLMRHVLPLCSPAEATIDNLKEILRWCAEKTNKTTLLPGANRDDVLDFFTSGPARGGGYEHGGRVSGSLALSYVARDWPPGFV